MGAVFCRGFEMKRVGFVLGVAASLWAGAASADSGKDERGGGRERDRYERSDRRGWDEPREDKLKWRTDDGCEVERKWKKGEYEEKVKCKPGRYGYRY